MFFFWRLVFAHLLGDFTFQTNRIARWKRESTSGILFHVLIHFFFTLGVTFQYFSWDILWRVALLTVLHAVEDQWRVRSIKYGSSDSMLFFLWDQVIHYLILLVCSPDPPMDPAGLVLPPERWAIIGALFVIATHFTTIFVYFLQKDIYGDARIIQREKFHGIAERCLIMLCFFIPSPYFWLTLAALVLGTFVERREVQRRGLFSDLDFSKTNLVTANTLAAACAVCSFFVYNSPSLH